MGADFDHVVAGVGMWRGEIGGHHLVGPHSRERGVPRAQGSVEPKKRAGYMRCRSAADPHHPNAAAARRRRDGHDRVVDLKHVRGKG
jgi:hypothetical protein